MWKAIIKDKQFINGRLKITIQFTNEHKEFIEEYDFSESPSDEDLGIIVHNKLSSLANIDTKFEEIKLNSEIIPVDPKVIEQAKIDEQLKIAQEKRQQEEQRAYEEAKKNEEEKKAVDESIAKSVTKCHVRTFVFEDETVEFHSICDKKDYSREDKPNNDLGLLTGAYVRDLLKKEKIKETIDSVHYLD